MRMWISLSAVVAMLLALPGLTLAEDFFSKTELQIHAEFDRQAGAPTDSDILTATLEHFSEWTYGDNYFFLDIEGEDDFEAEACTLYFEYAPRLSMDRVFDKVIVPCSFLGETYATVQYNDSDQLFINQVWLYGVSFDFDFQPNYGFSHLTFMVRDEDTQDISYQVTYVWGQPFQVAGLNMDFRGFADLWEDDEKSVFLTEPQLRLNMSSFFDENSPFSNVAIGTELELSHNLFGDDYGWEFNPTIFVAMTF